VVVGFIDVHKGRFGVVPICRVLRQHRCGIAPSSYYAFATRERSARALRDDDLVAEITRVYTARRLGRSLYGARRVWLQLRREGVAVARCTVERLMQFTVTLPVITYGEPPVVHVVFDAIVPDTFVAHAGAAPNQTANRDQHRDHERRPDHRGTSHSGGAPQGHRLNPSR
jgi:hypothetical protein